MDVDLPAMNDNIGDLSQQLTVLKATKAAGASDPSEQL
jgi:hypothetical protein